MSGTIILAIVLAVIVVVGSAALIMRSGGGRGNARDLRRRFGPEYDRVAARHSDQAAAEQELAARVREHDALTLRPLAADERARYERTWTGVQERFIEDPRGATQQADQVIGGLLTAIGYPSEDREKQLDLASVDHAYALNDYREARDLATRDGSAPSSTEALRQALLHYRVMFEDLLGSASAERAHAGQR